MTRSEESTISEYDPAQLTAAQTALDDAVRQLTQPTVHHIHRDSAEDDPGVREVDDAHRARTGELRAEHAAALRRRDRAGMRRVLARLIAHEQQAQARRATLARLPSMLEQLDDAVHSTQGGGGAAAGPHRSPIGLAAAELLHAIDRACAGCPGTTRTERLRYWAGLSGTWRVSDPDRLLLYALDAQRWVEQGWAILDPSRVTPIPGMCPSCRRRTVRTPDDLGEQVERPVLNLTRDEGTVHCTAPCRASWPPDRLRWLGELLREQDAEQAGPAEVDPTELLEAG